MKVLRMIRAVAFDLWSTLLRNRNYSSHRIDTLAHALESEGFHRDRDTVEAAYLSTMAFFNEAWRTERRHIPATELTKFILDRLDVSLPSALQNRLVKDFEEAIFVDPPQLVKGAKKVLKALHGFYEIGLISNSGVTPGRILRRVLSIRGILKYFDCTVFSDEVGHQKPHPLIFKKAVGEMQVKAGEAIHVGDLLESDIAGAKALGMKAVWFNRTGSNREKTKTKFVPDYEIKALSELLEFLSK